jgi:NAD(P)-dependent dehydrogenase (short-subunit alcohol dehydrogenase family)
MMRSAPSPGVMRERKSRWEKGGARYRRFSRHRVGDSRTIDSRSLRGGYRDERSGRSGHLFDAGRLEDDSSVSESYAWLAERALAPLIIVNNAGITRDNLLLRMKPEEWQSVIDTNLTGLYRVIKPALRAMMKARWGRIINLSSVVARMGNPGQSNYVASNIPGDHCQRGSTRLHRDGYDGRPVFGTD